MNDHIDRIITSKEPKVTVEPDVPIPPGVLAPGRMELENGSYATLEDGIVHLHLADNTELFAVDVNTVRFEKKFLLAMMQIFLIGIQRGRSTELANVRQKLGQILNLVFS